MLQRRVLHGGRHPRVPQQLAPSSDCATTRRHNERSTEVPAEARARLVRSRTRCTGCQITPRSLDRPVAHDQLVRLTAAGQRRVTKDKYPSARSRPRRGRTPPDSCTQANSTLTVGPCHRGSVSHELTSLPRRPEGLEQLSDELVREPHYRHPHDLGCCDHCMDLWIGLRCSPPALMASSAITTR